MMTIKNEDKIQSAREFYDDRIIGWMLSDLEKSADIGTNFLTALGCFVYTEIIGAFLPPLSNKDKGRKEQRNFYSCFYRLELGKLLEQLDKAILELSNSNIYKHFRNRMCHKYYPSISKKQSGQVLFISGVVARDGFWKDKLANLKIRSAPIFIDNDNRV